MSKRNTKESIQSLRDILNDYEIKVSRLEIIATVLFLAFGILFSILG